MTTNIYTCSRCEGTGRKGDKACRQCQGEGTWSRHPATLEDIKSQRDWIETLAEDDRFVDRTLGYGLEDFVDVVEQSCYTDGLLWELPGQMDDPVVKALAKIYRKVMREMRAG